MSPVGIDSSELGLSLYIALGNYAVTLKYFFFLPSAAKAATRHLQEVLLGGGVLWHLIFIFAFS